MAKAKDPSRQRQGKAARAKGARGELELAAHLSDLLGVKFIRAQQYCGKAGDADIRCDEVQGIHWESKRTETLSLYTAMEQASADARAGEVPVVCHRRNGKQWLLVLNLDDLPQLFLKLAPLLIETDDDAPSN